MIFSKRLTSSLAHLSFILFTIFVLAILEPDVRNQQHAIVPLIGLAGVWVLVGTIGWHLVQRRALSELVAAYFFFQIIWLVIVMLFEVQYARYAPATAAFAILLIFQISVLQLRWRILLLTLFIALAFLFTIRNVSEFERIMPILISYILGYGVVFLSGNLIVGGERANQRSLKLAEYATNVEELATLRERNRLAREIHDNLGHYLTAINIQLEAALALLDIDRERTRTTLQKAQTLSKDGLEEIRRSIQSLRASPIENRTLPEALTLLVEEHHAAGHQIKFDIHGEAQPCTAAVEMTVYRIVQEGLTNIRKYAQAELSELQLSYRDPHHIEVILRDNGVGSRNTASGFGLIGLQERVQLLGGKLTTRTGQGQGFILQGTIPR